MTMQLHLSRRSSLSRGGLAKSLNAKQASAENARAVKAAKFVETGPTWLCSWREQSQSGAVEIFLTELRAHGSYESACRVSRISLQLIHRWRKMVPEFSELVLWALEFAQSDALSYRDWRATQQGAPPERKRFTSSRHLTSTSSRARRSRANSSRTQQ